MEQESLVDQKLVRSLQLEIAKLQVDLNSKKDELEEAISTQVSKKFRLFVFMCFAEICFNFFQHLLEVQNCHNKIHNQNFQTSNFYAFKQIDYSSYRQGSLAFVLVLLIFVVGFPDRAAGEAEHHRDGGQAGGPRGPD